MHEMATKRLILREYGKKDDPFLLNLLASQAVMQWLFAGKPLDRTEARAFIAEHFTFGKSPTGLGILSLKQDQKPIGFAGLLKCNVLSRTDYELGFAICEHQWGRGYATEIGRGQIKYGLSKLGLDRILALVHPKNKRSRHVVEKLPMKWMQTLDKPGRGIRDVYVSPPESGGDMH